MVYLGQRAAYPSDDLVAAARNGDDGAFTSLYYMYREMVNYTVAKYFDDGTDAEDASQTTWAKVISRLNQVRDTKYLPVWIHQVAVRTSLQMLRAENRRAAAKLTIRPAALDGAGTLESDYLERVDVDRALGALPPRMGVLAAYLLAGHHLIDAARLMGISEGTAKSQRFKAACKLRGGVVSS